MRAIDVIEKKRDGYPLSYEEIEFMVMGYTNHVIPDYQMSAFLMAVYFTGMTDKETTDLATIMLNSGDQIDLSSLEGIKVDKHSTGGVGDKTSLVLAPMVASLGINFAKMSGRGLGHTGGTLDKLESIPGYNINIGTQDFLNQVKNIHIALVGQTGNLTPADKVLYSLRDVTGTVPSIPLIASSIMSKKLASGADAICIDCKVGSGAFMKDIESARKLSKLMIEIGKAHNKMMTCVLTNMDEPLGYAVGNSLEVIEAIDTLNMKGPNDLLDLCLTIGSYLVVDAKKALDLDAARALLLEQIENGKALDKLAELVKAQGGDSSYIYDTKKFKQAKNIIPIYAHEDGYVERIDALMVGHSAMLLGAGRTKLTDSITFEVGIKLNKKVGDKVSKNDILAYLYSNNDNSDEALKLLEDSFTINKDKIIPKLILEVIR